MPAGSRAFVLQVKPVSMDESLAFADEKSRIAWEIGRRVSDLELPTETPTMTAHTIRFDTTHRTQGTYAILLAGMVVGTAEEGVFVVPERTLIALRQLGIPYYEE